MQKYWALYLLAIVGLWYAFGRKWSFMRECNKKERITPCEDMYSSFVKSMPWSPFAWY